MKITCLTPLHIGTGEEVPDFEYGFLKESGTLARFSLARLLAGDPSIQENPEIAGTPENLRQYLCSAPWKDPKFRLYELAGEAEIFWQECQAKSGRLAPIAVRETMKTAYKMQPLFPGSSLKGALLTSWLFGKFWEKLAEEDQALLRDVNDRSFDNDWSTFYRTRKKSKEQRRPIPSEDQNLFDLLDPLFNSKNPEWEPVQRKLSDRLSIPDVELTGGLLIHQVQRKSNAAQKALPQWIECVAAGATGRLSARLDERQTQLYTAHELCRRANLFAEVLLTAELQFFNHAQETMPAAYKNHGEVDAAILAARQTSQTCVVRVGWASNKNATSITLLNSAADLSKQPDPRQEYGDQKKKAEERRRPKTRWLTLSGAPLGWCKVEFEEGDYVR